VPGSRCSCFLPRGSKRFVCPRPRAFDEFQWKAKLALVIGNQGEDFLMSDDNQT